MNDERLQQDLENSLKTKRIHGEYNLIDILFQILLSRYKRTLRGQPPLRCAGTQNGHTSSCSLPHPPFTIRHPYHPLIRSFRTKITAAGIRTSQVRTMSLSQPFPRCRVSVGQPAARKKQASPHSLQRLVNSMVVSQYILTIQ